MSARHEEDIHQQELMLIGHKQDNEDRLHRERLALFVQQQEHHDRPSTKYSPRLSIDGDHWCALFGDNLQDGVAGFGKSPAEAFRAFDLAWTEKLPDAAESKKQARAAAAPSLLEAAEKARSAIDRLMGDTDLDLDDSPEFHAMKALNAAIALARGEQ